jgi:predicted Zn-dependent protease
MQQGPKTDIITGLPLETILTDRETEALAREEASLKSKAEFFGLSESIDGKKLIALIQQNLERRIDYLVDNDPQAKAYMNLLTEIGVKENQAQKAAEKLVNMRIKKE